MADINPGQFQGNEQAATDYLRGLGRGDPSSGAVRYAAYGDAGYSQGDAERFGLPLTSGILRGQQQEAIKPALQSYEASIPEISQKFGAEKTRLSGEKQPLIDRYQNLLADLTGRETKETGRGATALAREYGKRGVPLSSGAYEQNLNQQLGDISQFYGGQRKDVGLAQEADLRDLDNLISKQTGLEVESIRSVRNAIAQLQAGAGQQGLSDALSLYKTQQAQQFESRFDPLNKQLLEKQIQGETKSPYIQLGEGETLFDLNTLQSIFKNPKTKVAGEDDTLGLR